MNMSKYLFGCIEIKCEWIGQDLYRNATAKETKFCHNQFAPNDNDSTLKRNMLTWN